MAVILEANYSKKLGLPNFSSHQYSVTIRTELTDLTQVEGESAKLYRLLQDAVDREIQEVGFMPDALTYGMNNGAAGKGGAHAHTGNGQGHGPLGNGERASNGDSVWHCSDKQRNYIEKIVREHHLDKRNVEDLAVELFGLGVKQLDRLQASGLIDELLERHGGQPRGQKRPYRRERVGTNGGGRS
jgi:hypothetical protein